ncbi:MAG: hypothetical protein ACREJ2_09270 [Planctomycetota bacterium]
MSTQAAMLCSPLESLALEELKRHRWIESEKACCDLGDSAFVEWRKKYWAKWLRARVMEHLNGDFFWEEVDCDDFGLLQNNFHRNEVLLQEIVLRIKDGQENLSIINWVIDTDRSLQDALVILRKIDINARRIPCFRFIP